MTRDDAHQVFERLRGRFAAKHPAVAKVRLRLARKHFLKRPAARDLAWYEPSERTVYLMERALAGHAGRVSGLLAHELGHAADSDTSRPYAELRADALAKAAIGRPIRYDAGDVQNLEVGVTPRPPYLHENKPMKRNPRTPFSNSPPPASSNWSGFARAADVGELDLDAIADATGYGGWYSLDRSISPSTIANERNTPSGSVRFTKFAKAIRAHSLKLSKASADRIARALLAERPYKRNPTTAYHRARGDAQLVLAEDAYKKAKAMSRRGDAKGAHDSLIHAHRMAALAESDLTDGASTKAAKAKSLTWWKAYSQLAQSPKRNPAKGYKMPEAQARHTAEGLLARMKADGADTFAKKVKWVKKHIPSIDRPRTFVGWVTKGERGRVVYQRNPKASVKQQILALDRRIKAMEEAGYAPHSLIEKRDLLVAKVRRRKP